jgi:hypothetical protein
LVFALPAMVHHEFAATHNPTFPRAHGAVSGNDGAGWLDAALSCLNVALDSREMGANKNQRWRCSPCRTC